MAKYLVVDASSIRVGGAVNVLSDFLFNFNKFLPDETIKPILILNPSVKSLGFASLYPNFDVYYFSFSLSYFFRRFLRNSPNYLPDNYFLFVLGAPSYINHRYASFKVIRLTAPWVISFNFHAFNVVGFNSWFRSVTKGFVKSLFCYGYNIYISQTQSALNLIANRFGSDSKLVLVPNIPNHLSELTVSKKKSNFFCALPGTPYPHKNMMTVLRALLSFNMRSSTPIYLRVMWDVNNPLSHPLLDFVSKHNISQYIENWGYVVQSDLSKFYDGCSCVVLPSVVEVSSASLVEASVLQLPTIFAESPVNLALIDSGGLSFSPTDINQLTDHFHTCLNFPDKIPPVVLNTFSNKNLSSVIFNLAKSFS